MGKGKEHQGNCNRERERESQPFNISHRRNVPSSPTLTTVIIYTTRSSPPFLTSKYKTSSKSSKRGGRKRGKSCFKRRDEIRLQLNKLPTGIDGLWLGLGRVIGNHISDIRFPAEGHGPNDYYMVNCG